MQRYEKITKLYLKSGSIKRQTAAQFIDNLLVAITRYRPIAHILIFGLPYLFAILISVFIVSGNTDILAQVAVADTDALYDFVIDGLTQKAEASDVHTSIVFEHFQKHLVKPLLPSTTTS